MRFEYLIGLRYLRARRRERFVSLIAFISLAGVMLGTFALTVDLAVMSGFEEDLHARLLAFNPHILVQQTAALAADPKVDALQRSVATRIAALPGVVGVAPYISGQVMVVGGATTGSPGYVTGGLMRGVVARDNPVLIDLQKTLVAGTLAGLAQRHPVKVHSSDGERVVDLPGVIVGKSLASDLDIHMDQPVTVIAPTSFGANSAVPRLRRFVVTGFFYSGMAEYDSTLLFASLPEAQALVADSPQFDRGLEVRVADIFAAPRIARQIEQFAGRQWQVNDWTQNDVSLFVGLRMEKFTHFLVLLLIVLVAAFNIVATLVMVVMERRKEIAILQAMGARGSSVGGIFLFEGVTLGSVGTVLGVGAGLLLCYLQSKFQLVRLPPELFMVSAVPVRLYPLNFLLVGLAAVSLCIAAALYPAMQARALSPVEVIRYE